MRAVAIAGLCASLVLSTFAMPRQLFGGQTTEVKGFQFCPRCTTKKAPVCGSDGVTYMNSCHAECVKVEVEKVGMCPTGPDDQIFCNPMIQGPPQYCPTKGHAQTSADVVYPCPQCGKEVCNCAKAVAVRVENTIPNPCKNKGTCLEDCEFGRARDTNGCETCTCAKSTDGDALPNPCHGLSTCIMPCQFGEATDQNGCGQCKCNNASHAANPCYGKGVVLGLRCENGRDTDVSGCLKTTCASEPWSAYWLGQKGENCTRDSEVTCDHGLYCVGATFQRVGSCQTKPLQTATHAPTTAHHGGSGVTITSGSNGAGVSLTAGPGGLVIGGHK